MGLLDRITSVLGGNRREMDAEADAQTRARREAFYEVEKTKDPLKYAEYLRIWAIEHDAGNKTGWLSADDWISPKLSLSHWIRAPAIAIDPSSA